MNDRLPIYGRDTELQRLRQMLQARRSFLLDGPAGVGKTFLTQQVASQSPELLYSPQSTTSQSTFRALAAELVNCGNTTVVKTLGGPASALKRINQISAISIRGVVGEGLRQGAYWIILDGLQCPSQTFAAAIKEVSAWTSTAGLPPLNLRPS